ILASPARRTRESAAALQRVWNTPASAADIARARTPVELQFEPRLYLASLDTLRDIINQKIAERPHLLLVGHNPGLSDLLQHFDVHRALGTGDWHSLPLQGDT
ncbi:MAG: SixA phosphatase family protein, partial [Nevskiaceae bacterium]